MLCGQTDYHSLWRPSFMNSSFSRLVHTLVYTLVHTFEFLTLLPVPTKYAVAVLLWEGGEVWPQGGALPLYSVFSKIKKCKQSGLPNEGTLLPPHSSPHTLRTSFMHFR